MAELSKELIEKVYELIEIAKKTGKIRKGSNETTKSIEKGEAKVVAIANDVNPPEIIMHIPLICKEKGIVCISVGPKAELGAAAGLEVGTGAIAIVEPGDAKSILREIIEKSGEKPKKEVKEEVDEEKQEEEKTKKNKEEKKEKEVGNDKKIGEKEEHKAEKENKSNKSKETSEEKENKELTKEKIESNE